AGSVERNSVLVDQRLFERLRLVFVLFLFVVLFLVVIVRILGLELQIQPDLGELGLEQLEQLVGVVAAPLVEYVRQVFVEVGAIETTLDLFDLVLTERFEDLFSQRIEVAFLDSFLGGYPHLSRCAPVEVYFHAAACLLGKTPLRLHNGLSMRQGYSPAIGVPLRQALGRPAGLRGSRW